MNLVFVTEARFVKGKDGRIYGDAAFSKTLWNRYLTKFDTIFIIARIDQSSANIEGKHCSESENVVFLSLPYYVGPIDYLKKYNQLKREIRNHIQNHLQDKFICRTPGYISDLVINELLREKKKYAVEVVGDPDEVFEEGGVKHPLRKYLRKKGVEKLKRNVLGAGAALYVTKETLQRKYPVRKGVFQTYASNVNININHDLPAKTFQDKKNYRIISIGSLEQMYKAPDIVIEALHILKQQGFEKEIELVWLGIGKYLEEVKNLAAEKSLGQDIIFPGQVSSEEVIKYLDNSDIFVLVSRTEGLPRALIEAMSRGLPSIGSRVGGIPELLQHVVLVQKNDAPQLVAKIKELLTSEEFYNEQSKTNLTAAQDYDNELLTARREEFYNFIINNC